MKPYRLVFLHIARDDSVEYRKHRRLAAFARREAIDPYFLWQSSREAAERDATSGLGGPERNFYFDYGRDLSLEPRPSRLQRAIMMAKRLLPGYAFLNERLKTLKPDALYTSQQSIDVSVARRFSQRLGVPHLIHISYPIGPWLGNKTLETLRETPTVITVSDFIRNTGIEFGIPAERMHKVYNPAELDKFDLPRDPDYIRKEFGYAPDAQIIICAGRLDPGKGMDTLIDAFATLRADFPKARVLICGKTFTRDGYDRELEDRVASHGLGEVIRFGGHRKDMARLYAGADIFCLPTLHEAFGFVFTEAMLARLPVVACASGGVPEIVEDGKSGFLAPPESVEGVATGLRTLLADPERARRMGEAGRESVYARFAPPIVAARWEQVVVEALRK